MSHNKQRVVLLGASERPDRYAYLALKQLLQHGHEVIPVSPKLKEVEGLPVLARLDQVQGPVDTLTLYVGRAGSTVLIDQIVQLKPGRVIFNPGSENAELEVALQQHGVPFEHACTLVLLRTGQF